MKSLRSIMTAVVLLLLVVGAADAQESAQAHYLHASEAFGRGDLDLAISEWKKALWIKPSSSLTKDRLIEALSLKVDNLERTIVQLKNSNGGAKIADAWPTAGAQGYTAASPGSSKDGVYVTDLTWVLAYPGLPSGSETLYCVQGVVENRANRPAPCVEISIDVYRKRPGPLDVAVVPDTRRAAVPIPTYRGEASVYDLEAGQKKIFVLKTYDRFGTIEDDSFTHFPRTTVLVKRSEGAVSDVYRLVVSNIDVTWTQPPATMRAD